MAIKKKQDLSTKGMVRQSNRFFNWIQEYSKKIIFVVFIIYVIIHLYIIIMNTIMYFRTGDVQCLDTLISEINITFRDVIGGYIIKAAVENVSKYSGAIMEKYIDLLTLKVMEKSDDFDSEEVREQASNIIERNGLKWRQKQ